jgi:hypothetical protein
MRTTMLTKDLDKWALIKRLCDKKMSLMFFYEKEPEENLQYEKIDKGIHLVHPPYDYKTLEKWLYYGNWQAVFPANREHKPFDTFRIENTEIEKRMNDSNLLLLIDSFHDDTTWNVIGDF